MRHMTLLIDRNKTKKYNYLFHFLSVYGKMCFAAFLVCNFNFDFMKHYNYCKETILLYNIHIDMVKLYSILFLLGTCCCNLFSKNLRRR